MCDHFYLNPIYETEVHDIDVHKRASFLCQVVCMRVEGMQLSSGLGLCGCLLDSLCCMLKSREDQSFLSRDLGA